MPRAHGSSLNKGMNAKWQASKASECVSTIATSYNIISILKLKILIGELLM